jgi:hypothetical protein
MGVVKVLFHPRRSGAQGGLRVGPQGVDFGLLFGAKWHLRQSFA